ncbi:MULTISPECIES: hypothetical protein [Ruegeria]|uniref:hypothetical protein n=1 Tax=Ruegeria TaxID=97050 RepID=UPI00147E38C2|nr:MULTISPECIES: hypothetical protein [Ruegeria]MBO9409991.1 hypothetical protein [Ruegeria sp. R8_1]MBO9414790.1 hypothetical protein [Ruegeria sp. R8_2]
MVLRGSMLALAAVIGLTAINATPVVAKEPTKSVSVFSRTWAITQVSDAPVVYRATRDNNNLNPFGPPPRLRTLQAIAAIQQATGCTPIRGSMYQNISGQFFSQVSCN